MTAMVFRDRDDTYLWSSTPLAPNQPIPRIGESVRHDSSGGVWRVTDVRHVWAPVAGAPSDGAHCSIVAIYIKPEEAR